MRPADGEHRLKLAAIHRAGIAHDQRLAREDGERPTAAAGKPRPGLGDQRQTAGRDIVLGEIRPP